MLLCLGRYVIVRVVQQSRREYDPVMSHSTAFHGSDPLAVCVKVPITVLYAPARDAAGVCDLIAKPLQILPASTQVPECPVLA